jgi:DNA helicase-2/ATP-dependent DNA helicase PcrA
VTQQSSFLFPDPSPRAPEPPARTNLVIEAGAGTGKTTRIVAEVLRLMLANEDLSPDRIVLVTFSEKAAGEIADRIREALTDLAGQFEEAARAEAPVPHQEPLPHEALGTFTAGETPTSHTASLSPQSSVLSPRLSWPRGSANPLIVVPDDERESWQRA